MNGGHVSMKIVIGCIVVVVAAVTGIVYPFLRMAGRENDDQQQLEYIWKLQDKKKQKEKK